MIKVDQQKTKNKNEGNKNSNPNLVAEPIEKTTDANQLHDFFGDQN